VESVGNLAHVLAGLRGESTTNMRSLLEYRRALELPCALLAAKRATEAEFGRLRGLVDLLGETLERSHAEVLQVDTRFHVTVAELSQNRLLAQSLSETLSEILVLRSFFPHGFVEIRQSYLNQQVLLEALESREPAAIRAAVDDHLGALEEIALGFRLGFADDREASPSGSSRRL